MPITLSLHHVRIGETILQHRTIVQYNTAGFDCCSKTRNKFTILHQNASKFTIIQHASKFTIITNGAKKQYSTVHVLNYVKLLYSNEQTPFQYVSVSYSSTVRYCACWIL